MVVASAQCTEHSGKVSTELKEIVPRRTAETLGETMTAVTDSLVAFAQG